MGMRIFFSPLCAFSHRIAPEEVDAGKDGYSIRIEDGRIRKTAFSDLMVKGPFGLEPAIGYSRLGVGSVFKDLRIEDGLASMSFASCANQSVRSPVGMRLLFVS
jgi:hypothetical protein